MIELLAPARDTRIALAAIAAGADAIYIGASSHGARANASNELTEIAKLVETAHRFCVRVYVTVNTLVYDNEIEDVEDLIRKLYSIGVDALIVQDLGVMEMQIPPIELHASTQCDIRNVEKAIFLGNAGFSRVVVAREMGANDIKSLRSIPGAPDVEAFCHGALCVCYSGDCHASLATTGRSANRGECAQFCRLKYDLVNDKGETLAKQKHLLSLRDMNRIERIGEMLDAGVTSFKIEGRLKEESYVVNAVAAYRRALDRGMEKRGLAKSSQGRCNAGFSPDLKKEFNRGFTDYFLSGVSKKIASFDSPAYVGESIGIVNAVNDCEVSLDLRRGISPLSNGDGLTFYGHDGKLNGFRINRVEGNKVALRSPLPALRPGMVLFRNYFKEHSDAMHRAKMVRTLDVSFVLRLACNNTLVCLDAEDERGNAITATIEIAQTEPSMTPQATPRRRLLTKTGDTIYRVSKVIDLVGDLFIPASSITALRRRALALLDRAQKMTYQFNYRKAQTYPKCDAAFNVSNQLAQRFYEKCGATNIEKAMEIAKPNGDSVRVMTCRYCLRRELGKCLKDGAKPEGWFLLGANFRYRLDFDCKNCRMNVYLEKGQRPPQF